MARKGHSIVDAPFRPANTVKDITEAALKKRSCFRAEARRIRDVRGLNVCFISGGVLLTGLCWSEIIVMIQGIEEKRILFSAVCRRPDGFHAKSEPAFGTGDPVRVCPHQFAQRWTAGAVRQTGWLPILLYAEADGPQSAEALCFRKLTGFCCESRRTSCSLRSVFWYGC